MPRELKFPILTKLDAGKGIDVTGHDSEEFRAKARAYAKRRGKQLGISVGKKSGKVTMQMV